MDANANLMQTTTSSITLLATQINDVFVSPDSLVVGEEDVSYQFAINNTNTLDANSQILIKFPSEILLSLGTPLVYKDSLQISSASVTSNTIDIPLQNSSPLSPSSLAAINITITDITNPLNMKITSSFEVSLANSLGDII